MPTLKATVDKDLAAVRLLVDDRAGVTAIIRTDTNGTREVRLPGHLRLPGIDSGEFVDYEAALGGRVSYRLVHPDFRDLVWVDLSGDWQPRFILPAQPNVAMTVPLVTQYSAARDTGSTFHRVIGRPDPLVVEGQLLTRTGTLRAEFDTLAASAGLEALLRRGKTVMYRQSEHPGMDMYFHVSKFGTEYDPELGAWTVSVDYTEVSWPTGPLESNISWTYAAVSAAYTNFTELSLAYESYVDLITGDEK